MIDIIIVFCIYVFRFYNIYILYLINILCIIYYYMFGCLLIVYESIYIGLFKSLYMYIYI